MPLTRLNGTYLLDLKARQPELGGRLLCLGVPTPVEGLDYDWIDSTAKGFGLDLKLDGPGTTECKDYPSFFSLLGFSQAESLDISDFEGAEHILDLNQAETPEHLQERFDVILNHGTLEHVFHLPNALANVFRMLRPGGVVIHLTPINNLVGHGFYQLSPCFFWDYYLSNRYEVLDSMMTTREDRFADYKQYGERPHYPYRVPHVSLIGAFSGGYQALFFVARKTPEARFDVIPQQGSGAGFL